MITRLEKQENKMDKLVDIINNFCAVSIKSTEQLTNAIMLIKDEIEKYKTSHKSLTDLITLLRENYDKQFKRTHEVVTMFFISKINPSK